METGVKITQEMIDDWTGPDGFIDLNGGYADYSTHSIWKDGNLVFVVCAPDGTQQYAVEASGQEGRGRSWCPHWLPNNGFVEIPSPMADPEFSLDEMSMAEEIMETLK